MQKKVSKDLCKIAAYALCEPWALGCEIVPFLRILPLFSALKGC